MGVKFTDEQRLAIETLDKSVLVSAAAGSGKTAVLVQRIINIILSGKADVDEMLVVTFTSAAAAEMRLKLAKAIKERMKDDTANRATLRRQLNKLYRSYISTFDSFAVRVIKEFFYEIDIEPNFKACDEIQSELMKREALDSLFEEAFVCDELIAGGSFRSFLRLYSKERTEETFKTDLLDAYSKLRTMPDYWNWAFRKAENLKVTKDSFANSYVAKSIIQDARRELAIAEESVDEILDMFIANGIEKKFYDIFGSEYYPVKTLVKKIDEEIIDDEFIDTILGMEWFNLTKVNDFFEANEKEEKKIYTSFKKQITPIRKNCKDAINNLRNCYFIPDFETRLHEMNASYEYTVYYLNLMKAFEERYQMLKRDAGVLDFADMEHIAVQILEKDVPAETLRRRFKYIFIDEYQDTNNIQEYLIARFAKPDNVFKVGDIKQSIYKFRQAEPAIFERVHREYSDANNGDATAIDLNKNFRSNDATINYINEVFRHAMPGYDEKAQLYTGLNEGPAYQDAFDFRPEVHFLCKEELEAEIKDETPEMDATDDLAEEEIESLSVEEAEAKYIAELVRSLIGTEFYDTKNKVVRKAAARDIVILFRATKRRADTMARALRDADIQAHIEEDDNYFDTVEIGVALSLFSCIDNMKRDVPLIATLHSEAFGWTPEELAKVRIAHREYVQTNESAYRKPPYWEAVAWYAENGNDEQLKEKVQFAISKIREWRELSNMMSVEDFIWKVLIDSGYYLRVGAMYDGDRRQANLRVLVDRARQYSEGTVASLSSFLKFIEIMKTKKIANGQASMVSKDDDVVRISTIHKSKGLEYPFVIVGGLGHAFRYDNNAMNLSFDSELGVAMPYVDPDRKYWRSTILQRAINAKSRADSYDEELRVLYVAMTRARNKLVLVGTEKSEAAVSGYIPHPNNFLKVLGASLDTEYNDYYVKSLERTSISAAHTRFGDLLSSRSKELSPEALIVYDEIDRRLSYEYPDKDDLSTPSKYSVSAIRREELKSEDELDPENAGTAAPTDTEVVNLWHLTDNKKKASAADIGIAYHRIMEYLDFTRVSSAQAPAADNFVDCDYISASAHYLLDKGAIDETVFNHIDLSRIEDFFTSPLGQRAIAAARAGKLLKEKAFTLETEWQGKDVLVQGVIDCCWTELDETGQETAILIDYKSNYINPHKSFDEEAARIRKEYATQIALYSQAIKEGTGVPVSESYLYLFAAGKAIEM